MTRKSMDSLECIFCCKDFRLNIFFPFCPECGEPLLLAYPAKKREFHPEKTYPLDIFRDFLPLSSADQSLSLGEGNTPLIRLNKIEKKYSLPLLFAKNETFNPTHSFKDRGTVVAIHKAVSMGITKVGTVSTGNMAASTAAYGAIAGLETFLLLKEETSEEKLIAAGVYGPVLIKVKGDYGELFKRSFSLGQKFGVYFVNSVDPFRIEGYKVTGFEIFLQLQREIPQFIFVPLSSGGHLTGLMRAFLDLKSEGIARKYPTFVGVQAKGCSPLERAFAEKKPNYKRICKADTIAHAISNPDPPAGNIVLKLIRENEGIIVSVSDREILEAQKILAEEGGIFCQPESATTLAAVLKLSKKKIFRHQDKIVLIITGSGLKAMETIEPSEIKIHHASLLSLESTLDKLL